MRHFTYMVTHTPMHSLAHPPCTHGGHIPAALSSPPERFPSSHQRCFSSSLFSFPSRPAPHRTKPGLPAGHHTPALALHQRRSLQFIVVAPGPWWQHSAPSPFAMGQEFPSAGPRGVLRPCRGAWIPAQLPAPCGNRCVSVVLVIWTQFSQGWLYEAEQRIRPKKFTWEMKSPFLFG